MANLNLFFVEKMSLRTPIFSLDVSMNDMDLKAAVSFFGSPLILVADVMGVLVVLTSRLLLILVIF